jgi:hypothetical protein
MSTMLASRRRYESSHSANIAASAPTSVVPRSATPCTSVDALGAEAEL